MAHKMTVRTPEEVTAVVPHLLGFHPHDSIVVMPTQPGAPTARFDLPHTPDEREAMLDVIGPLTAHSGQGSQVALICFSDAPADAEVGSRYLAAGLEHAGVETQIRIWANDDRWVDLDRGTTGPRTDETANRIAAEMVMAGKARPAESRESMAQSLVGDRQPVSHVLATARETVANSNPAAERDWALQRLSQFHDNGNRLSNTDAARMLVGIESTKVRDALWEDMSHNNADSHVAFWSDLTARAPDDVRTPAATMLAFSSWLSGDGAKAWVALDQIPEDQPSYPMAQLVTRALQIGLNPNRWDPQQAFERPKETTRAPSHPTQHHERNNIPGQHKPGPTAPDR